MSLETASIQLCTFVAVSSSLYYLLARRIEGDQRVDKRLEDIPRTTVDARAKYLAARRESSDLIRQKLVRLAARLVPNDQKEKTNLQARLMHAGIYAEWAPTAFITIKLLLIAIPPLVGFALGQMGIFEPVNALLMGAIIGGFGIVAPSIWLDQRKARHHLALMRSLPDFLDLMVTCVQSGLSLEAGLQRVSTELTVAHPLLSGELAIVQRQIEIGATPHQALRNFAERTDLPTLYNLSALIQQTRQFGTSIMDALRVQSEMLRYQREQRAEELAQKAAVKILFPTLIFIFPAIFVVLVGPAAVQLAEKFSDDQPKQVSRSR